MRFYACANFAGPPTHPTVVVVVTKQAAHIKRQRETERRIEERERERDKERENER